MPLNFTVFLIGLTIIIFCQRVFEIVIARKNVERGTIYCRWTFYALAIVHVLTGIFAILEYFVFKREINYFIVFLGLFLFGVALIVRNKAIGKLGKFHSIHIEIRNDHELIKSGIYNYSRHPYYIAVCLEVPSLALIPNSIYSFWFAVFFYLPLVFFRAFKEEQTMAKKFGDEFFLYKKQVPALLKMKNLISI
jgi:protein-S-isoprenylcysteine O-methyltransferase Ste14